MVAPLQSLIDVGIDILNTVRDATTGTILAQLGSVVYSESESDRAEWWQHVGFLSRPSSPLSGNAAAQGIRYQRGDRDVIFGSRDQRGQQLAGQLNPGETCIYAPGDDGNAQGRALFKADGSVTLYTAKGNTTGGDSVAISLQPDGSVSIGTPFGGAVFGPNGITMMFKGSGPGAGIQINDSGVSILGQSIVANGANVLLGALASPATPVVYGPLGISGIGSASVFVSP